MSLSKLAAGLVADSTNDGSHLCVAVRDERLSRGLSVCLNQGRLFGNLCPNSLLAFILSAVKQESKHGRIKS